MDHLVASAQECQIEQICLIWDAGWHEAHDDIVPPKLCELRTRESFSDRIRKNLENTRLVMSEKIVLGFCMTKENELYQLYVARSARGTGVAQALMEDAEYRIRSKGHDKAWLACAVGNEKAARFYLKLGWVNSGLRTVALDISTGTFPLEVWQFEKDLHAGNVGRVRDL